MAELSTFNQRVEDEFLANATPQEARQYQTARANGSSVAQAITKAGGPDALAEATSSAQTSAPSTTTTAAQFRAAEAGAAGKANATEQQIIKEMNPVKPVAVTDPTVVPKDEPVVKEPTPEPDDPVVDTYYEGTGANRVLVKKHKSGKLDKTADPEAEVKKEPAGDKTEVYRHTDADGNIVIVYSDGTTGSGGKDPKWTPPITNAPVVPATSKTPSYQKTVYDKGGKVKVLQYYTDGTFDTISEETRTAADTAAAAMFANLGLDQKFIDSLMSVISGVYADNANPTDAEFLNAIYASEPYKIRFAGNEMIRSRIASGKGLPGDRMLSPAEYIQTEQTYRDYMSAAGLPTGFYDSPDDFANFIGNGVSPAEVKNRVDIASELLNKSDYNVVNALRDYYGLSTGDMLSYLIDPAKALPLLDQRNTAANLQKVFTASQVGGAAARQGFTSGDMLSDRTLAEEITTQGKEKYAETAFKTAAEMAPGVQRLSNIYGEYVDSQGVVREQLGLEGGVAAGQQRRKLASKERAKFQQQSAVGKTSLSKSMSL